MADAATWTDERVETLRKLWNEGLSASQIAGELGGVTRNAVIGKVHRLGLSGRAKAPSGASPVSRPRAKPAARLGNGTHAPSPAVRGATALQPQLRTQPDMRPEAQPALLDPEVVVPFSERVTIMELRDNMCRWPMGDPTTAEFRFCGMKTETGQPYCSYHCRIAYQPAGERRRERDEQRRTQQRA